MTPPPRLQIYSQMRDFGYQDTSDRRTTYYLEAADSTVTLEESDVVRHNGEHSSTTIERWTIDPEKLAAFIRENGTKLP